MKEWLREPITYVIIHIMMVIFTFGHAFNGVPKEEPGKFAGIDYTITNGGGTKTMVGIAAGFFWPLYWSVKLQEK